MDQMRALVLWHHLSKSDGSVVRTELASFEGASSALQALIRESNKGSDSFLERMTELRAIPHQIIVLSYRPDHE